MNYWLMGYAVVGVLCYLVGRSHGLRAGATITWRMMREGWLARGPRWPKDEKALGPLLDDLKRE